jgi:hypothetical protein
MDANLLKENLKGCSREIKPDYLNFIDRIRSDLEEDNNYDKNDINSKVFKRNINEIIRLDNAFGIFSPFWADEDFNYNLEQLQLYKSNDQVSKKGLLVLPYKSEKVDDHLIATLNAEANKNNIYFRRLNYISSDSDLVDDFMKTFKPKEYHLRQGKNGYDLVDLFGKKFKIPASYFIIRKSVALGQLDGVFYCKYPTSIDQLFKNQKCKIVNIKGTGIFSKGDYMILGLTYFNNITHAITKMTQELKDLQHVFTDFGEKAFHYLLFFQDLDYAEKVCSEFQDLYMEKRFYISCILIEGNMFMGIDLNKAINLSNISQYNTYVNIYNSSKKNDIYFNK